MSLLRQNQTIWYLLKISLLIQSWTMHHRNQILIVQQSWLIQHQNEMLIIKTMSLSIPPGDWDLLHRLKVVGEAFLINEDGVPKLLTAQNLHPPNHLLMI